MKLPMYFYSEISPKTYRIEECYIINVIERSWTITPDIFMDIFNPTNDEILMHEMANGPWSMPPPHTINELFCRFNIFCP